jgi:hypothetical protein
MFLIRPMTTAPTIRMIRSMFTLLPDEVPEDARFIARASESRCGRVSFPRSSASTGIDSRCAQSRSDGPAGGIMTDGGHPD